MDLEPLSSEQILARLKRAVANGDVSARANFSKTLLSAYDFKDLDLSGADFSGASIQNCHFTGAKLSGAQFCDAQAINCLFDRSNLSGANFRSAKLIGSTFDGVILSCADFRDANISGVKRLRMDGCLTNGLIQSSSTEEAWSALKNEFTGSRFVFSLIFLGIYFLPFAAKAATLAMLAQVQVGRNLGCGAEQCAERSIGSLLIGVDEVHFILGLYGWLLSVIILVYNALRFYLTFSVTRLKDAEATTGRSPFLWYGASSEIEPGFLDRYEPLICGARAISLLQWLALTAFILNALHWAMLKISVPV